MRMGERIKDKFNRYSNSGPTFVASGILFREQVFAQFLSSFSVQAKKKVVFTVTCQKKKKIGSVGRDFFFFFELKCIYVWFSLCFKSAILYP